MYIVTIYTGTFDNFFIYDDKYPSPLRAADIFFVGFSFSLNLNLRGWDKIENFGFRVKNTLFDSLFFIKKKRTYHKTI